MGMVPGSSTYSDRHWSLRMTGIKEVESRRNGMVVTGQEGKLDESGLRSDHR